MNPMLIILILMTCNIAYASIIEKNATIAVMDLETHEKISDKNVDLMNIEKSASEYVIQRLVTKTKLEIIDRETVHEKLKDLDTYGLTSLEDAKKIGEILGVKYIVYGSVTNFSTNTRIAHGHSWLPSESREIMIESQVTIRLMDVETGRILMVAKGIGKDSSTSGSIAFLIHAGEFQVTEQEVQKSLQKATFQAVDVLIERLFGNKKF